MNVIQYSLNTNRLYSNFQNFQNIKKDNKTIIKLIDLTNKTFHQIKEENLSLIANLITYCLAVIVGLLVILILVLSIKENQKIDKER